MKSWVKEIRQLRVGSGLTRPSPLSGNFDSTKVMRRRLCSSSLWCRERSQMLLKPWLVGKVFTLQIVWGWGRKEDRGSETLWGARLARSCLPGETNSLTLIAQPRMWGTGEYLKSGDPFLGLWRVWRILSLSLLVWGSVLWEEKD